MKNKIKEVQKLCDYYNLNLRIQYYGDRQVCFLGVREDEEEVFCISIWYPRNERKMDLRIYSDKEDYRNFGAFGKEEILLMLSLDELTDDELGIKPQKKEKENERI